MPALAALQRPLEEVRARAARWCEALVARGVEARVVELEGGGALAEQAVRSAGVALGGDAETLSSRLRAREPPVLGRIHEERLLLDARTVLEGRRQR